MPYKRNPNAERAHLRPRPAPVYARTQRVLDRLGRLDHCNDRQRLEQTVQRIRPRLMLLDPLVRLHGVDENAVAEIAPILPLPGRPDSRPCGR